MYYLNDLGILCTLGVGKPGVSAALLDRRAPLPEPAALFQHRGPYTVGAVEADLPPLPPGLERFECRNNRLAHAALEQIREAVSRAFVRHGAERIGVVMATSTAGIDESEKAVRAHRQDGIYPQGYQAVQGQLGGLGEFVAASLECAGPVYTLSTACSSSGNALLSARRLLAMDLVDAVVVGGVDSLCEMTLQGFGALEAQSRSHCRPFTAGRDGINLGEAVAIFLMSREPAAIRFMGGAGSSDAHHISAPHPEGQGALRSMSGALQDAGLTPAEIGYLNLHGTATPHNDAMETRAVNALFGESVPCSSTKSMTGHTLGAAGALELGLCWLLLSMDEHWRLPPSLYLADRDPALAPVLLVDPDSMAYRRPRHCMSNSFAFGGSNVSLIIGVANE
ncbi:beta-ketoacyl-ACP synthase [Pseudohalioglobus lutimaris]|uniref:Beta-ketoacyl-[acyl-carrier-protein] synthase II n=1 Tax=Pseudohalioglobus lutimaris TaxID=1737061 RepID=A0A2N5WZJ8_9GAMM|nr:beta-ketoacyl-ACP synthase [Pseudohalioglobus lutimaris]PLW67663.1 beta-ketoacyl-[acyl-carrier-protein] synthase II [Pseudohalioglobus lutimaris]